MKGLEISRSFWLEYGRPMMEKKFPELMPYIAVGLVGSGSECYGFDDEISRDHDFEHGFCIFLPGKDIIDDKTAFLAERAYYALPKEYMGLHRGLMNPAGGSRHGVFRTDEWFGRMTGLPGRPEGWRDFASLPDYALAEVTNGEIFYDGYGEYSAVREGWMNVPADYSAKKLCGMLMTMSQSFEYNYPRCLSRGDGVAARFAMDEYIKSVIGAAFWMNGRPVPYYKWSFRAMCGLDGTDELSSTVRDTVNGSNPEKYARCAKEIIMEKLRECGKIPEDCDDLQKAAFYLNNRISDTDLRNLSPLALV